MALQGDSIEATQAVQAGPEPVPPETGPRCEECRGMAQGGYSASFAMGRVHHTTETEHMGIYMQRTTQWEHFTDIRMVDLHLCRDCCLRIMNRHKLICSWFLVGGLALLAAFVVVLYFAAESKTQTERQLMLLVIPGTALVLFGLLAWKVLLPIRWVREGRTLKEELRERILKHVAVKATTARGLDGCMSRSEFQWAKDAQRIQGGA
ncbi:MAG: hypothetical protein HY823_00560 [Acidobacteria bacterium]|nr:hypothetical protein [Acidobacteriota bacterium]